MKLHFSLLASHMLLLCFLHHPVQAQSTSEKAGVFYEQALGAYQQKDIPLTRIYLDSAVLLDKNFAEAFARRGLLHYEFSEFEEALSDYQKALNLKPTEAKYHYQKGVTYYQLLRIEAAKTCFEAAIEHHPSHTEALTALGVLYAEQGEYKKSLDYQQKAMHYQPQYEVLYYNRSLVYIQLNKIKKAFADLETALTLKPAYEEARLLRLYLWQIQSEYDKLLEDVTYILHQNPYAAEAYYYQGNAYFALKRPKEACEAWQKATELGDMDAESQLSQHCERK